MVFPVVMYGCESWTIKKPEPQSIDAFELWCWRRLFRVLWTARRSNQSILKDIRIFIGRTDGAAENEMVGWHHRFNGHEFEQALGEGEGQGSLVCCSPWDHKESDTTEQLNNDNLHFSVPEDFCMGLHT